ncbi:Glucose-6-phosphate 1-dehydrogenase [Fasciola gigantica]|uniref:glucose-6-phosphate dehydrogenase (NADP(+)) n=1 Tax=Fasciola gigantica TaxID=46835 RepID=A0A504Y6U9_FASGI|nr:Glucose-6-phosphate 1-dehydrogenase [Fasciola gigantica]
MQMPHGEAIDCLSLIKSTIDEDSVHTHVVIVFGASGDLAKKKTYPSLWWLFRDGLLPPQTFVVGYARSNLEVLTIRKQSQPYLKVKPDQSVMVNEFWSHNFYVQGDYKDPEGFIKLNTFIETKWGLNVNRIFYFAIPPTIYTHVSENIYTHCMPKSLEVWARLIIEKPFGHDLESSNALSTHLSERFTEQQIYRIDHYLGKEIVQSLIILRFTNHILGPVWNKEHIANVTISFKEPFGTEGRGGYFDHFGIIRDVVQNHLMQILSLIAMERPRSIQADDIRDEKVSSLFALLVDVYIFVISAYYLSHHIAFSVP